MSDDLLRELARAKAVFQLRAIKAVIADQPSTPPGSTSNASPEATMQACPSGVTSSTDQPPASPAVMIMRLPLLASPDTRGTSP